MSKPIEIYDVIIDAFESSVSGKGVVRFEWDANIGFGIYELYEDDDNKWTADSECLDRGEDKNFLKLLLNKWVEQIEIKG